MILALAMIAMLMVSASVVVSKPAVAGDHGPICAYDGAGSARFKAYGDHVFLCDHGFDGHSVAVKLAYQHESKGYVKYWRWNWWGSLKGNGCKDLNLAVKENTIFKYKVCLGDHGAPGGKKADVLEWSCSGVASAWNNR
jgi:hypothetical protein